MVSRQEKIVQEKRLLEATKKNLLGPGGKLGVIAKILGYPIIRQGSGMLDQSYLYDPYDLDETDEADLPLCDEDYIMQEGIHFDGLDRGMHIEIKYLFSDKKLTVHHKGYLVYEEKAGELTAYAPAPEWEGMVDRLYSAARSKKNSLKEIERLEKEAALETKSKSILQRLRDRWGI